MITLDQFTWTRAENTLTAEESSLPPGCRTEQFTILSPATGREVVYTYAGATRDADGDVAFWSYAPAVSGLPIVHIYND